ncbi:MAG: DUF763 domain-containing protein [Candidatus Micrarchaeia archaeon]
MRTGHADLPLHHGKCPPWLFDRMKRLGGAITDVILLEYGRDEYLRRLSDPYFFQSLGCVLGFDWHSSGLTTTVCGALKEALADGDRGITFLGGKGKTSKKTPDEIQYFGEKWNLSTSKISKLVYASKAAAKVDNALLQDGYQLYHHSFVMTEDGKWAVIQQGLNNSNKYARRYHWLSDNIIDFVVEPHTAICCDEKKESVLNMTARESEESRKASVDLVKENPEKILKLVRENKDVRQSLLTDYGFSMDARHEIDLGLYKKLMDLNEFKPKNYEELMMFKGVGPKTIRSLALMSEVIYGVRPSWKDPVRYSFTHGGKDGFPYPVDKSLMDSSIEILGTAVEEARIGNIEKMMALRRLKDYLL